MDEGPSTVGVSQNGESEPVTVTALRATVDLAPIGLAQFDRHGRFLFVNDRLCSILGCSRREVLGRTFHELTFPDDLPRCMALNADLAAGKIPSYAVDKRFVRRDGSAVWTRITVSAARSTNGEVAFFIGAAEDISAQKEAVDRLRVAEERLRTALSASMIGTFRFDVRRNVLEWADGFERVFGTADNITLDQFFEVIHPDDRAQVMTSYMNSVSTGVDFEEEFRAMWPDGSVHWLHDRGRMVLGDDGKPHHILGAITDVTNHKRMEQVIHDRELRYRRALDVETIGVIFFDNDHRITGINKAFAEMSGYTNDEMANVMVLWRELTPDDDREHVRSRQAEFDTTGRTTPGEQEFVRKGGTRWWGLVTATRVSETEGVKYVLDISARKQAEREREDMLHREQLARIEAERATALRQQVLGFVAHDLRNPVHTIVMSAGALIDLPLAEDLRMQQLELIKRCAWGMDRLIGDLLDLSRIEAGTFAVRREPLPVRTIVSEVMTSFQDRAGAHGIVLESDVDPDPGLVDGDRQRMVQAVSNLVGNALKFTPAGGQIAIGARRSASHVELVVRDTGRGIPRENLDRIFDRFWQADRTAGGAGLGLAIVKGIVDAHDGTIRVESEPGHGTTVVVQLPFAARSVS